MPDLLTQLDSASPAERLRLYENSREVLTEADVRSARASQRSCAKWLALRWAAGAPGTALPDWQEAWTRLGSGLATPLDVVTLVLMPEGLRDQAHTVVELFGKLAGIAAVAPLPYLASWLVQAAMVASVADGRPEQGWALLDATDASYEQQTIGAARAYADPLRADPGVTRSRWVRCSAEALWAALEVPALPTLKPSPTLPVTDEGSLEDPRPVLARLRQLGAHYVRNGVLALVLGFGDMGIEGLELSEEEKVPFYSGEKAPHARLDEASTKATLAERLLVSGAAEDKREAVRLARESLASLPAGMGGAHAARSHRVLGTALLWTGAMAEAIDHLAQSLELQLRHETTPERNLTRIHLARAYLAHGRQADARHELERTVEDARSIGDHAALGDATLFLVGMDREAGQSDTAIARLQSVESILAGSPTRVVLALERLCPLRHGDELSGEFLTEIQRYAEGLEPVSPEADEFVRGLAASRASQLPEELRRQLLSNERLTGQDPVFRAMLLDAEGSEDDSLALLRNVMLEESGREVRLNAASRLIALLPHNAHGERLRWCNVVEDLLGDSTGLASIRSDLAAGLRMCAQGNPGLLHRAWRHAEQAATHFQEDPSALEVNTQVRARIRADQLLRELPSSSSTIIEMAAWFEEARMLPAEQLAEYRLLAARVLLHPGPLAHPDALKVAERLLGLASDHEETPGLRVRLQWIQAERAAPGRKQAKRKGKRPPQGPPLGPRGPFDDVPAWAVALVGGQKPDIGRALGHKEFEVVYTVAAVRPDRTEALLEWLFEQKPHAKAGRRGHDVLADMASLGPRGAVTQHLLQLVEQRLIQASSFPLLRLRVHLLRQTFQNGEGTAAYARAADELVAAARTLEERIDALLLKGIERMDAWQRRPLHDEQGRLMTEESRQCLEKALTEARAAHVRKSLLFPLLVSAGNAFLKGTAPDNERALALYREAESLGSSIDQEMARLWKVTADALLERKSPGDAERAMELLERALRFRRKGYLRVETLVLAARAEMEQPGREEPAQLQRALARIDEAVRHDSGENRSNLARAQLHYIGRLVQHRPGDRGLQQRLDELCQRFPELAKGVRRAKRGQVGEAPTDMVKMIMAWLGHPAGKAFTHALHPLLTPDPELMERMASTVGGLGKLPAEKRKLLEDDPSAREPRALRAHADRLERLKDPDALPGVTVGRARVLAHIAEYGLASASEVLRVADEAERLARRVKKPMVRRMLLLELAPVWSPRNHFSHPVRDFRRAAELLREVLEDCAPGDAIARDARQYLARATRYRTDGNVREHLLEAERLYEQCIQEYEAVGQMDVVAHVRGNLAELRSVLRPGRQDSALRDGIEAARQRLAEGGGPDRMADAQSSLACNLSRLGADLPTPEGDGLLSEAKELYEHLDWARLPSSAKASAENYQTICLAERALRSGKGDEAITLWRQRLDSIDRRTRPDEWGYTAHNLADMLLRVRPTLEQVMEALVLFEHALEIRTLERNAEHRWETCLNIGQVVEGLLFLDSLEAPGTFGGVPREALYERGKSALLSAIEAARRLDGGDRLMKAASLLLKLSTGASSLDELERTAEVAWSALDEARPYLLLDEEAGAEEAMGAAWVAGAVAWALAETGIQTVSHPEIEFLFSGERAERILRWMVRATGAAQRRLAGRTARPAAASHEAWVGWRAALQSGNPHAIGQALERLRQDEPLFLRGEPQLTATWNWLQSRPGSAAITVMESPGGLLAAILEHDGQPRVYVVGLNAGEPPVDEATVAARLTANGGGEAYKALLEWAHEQIIAPLRHLLSRVPTQLLWVPTGALRVLAPSDLWPASPVTCAVRLDLETRAYPGRPRRTLLTVADPGPGSRTVQEIPGAVESGVRLAHLAERVGPLRVRMSRGPAFGQQLGVACPGLIHGPASPDDIRRELKEADVAVFLCHGEVSGPRQAQLFLLDDAGAVATLDMERIADEPQRLAGATVVLLSCETGRVGDWLHRAAGLSGALLACGARSVIAPLWPVRVKPAVTVGEALLLGLPQGTDPAVTLHTLQAPERGAVLGGRVGREQLAAERAWSLRAFVHWMG